MLTCMESATQEFASILICSVLFLITLERLVAFFPANEATLTMTLLTAMLLPVIISSLNVYWISYGEGSLETLNPTHLTIRIGVDVAYIVAVIVFGNFIKRDAIFAKWAETILLILIVGIIYAYIRAIINGVLLAFTGILEFAEAVNNHHNQHAEK